MEQRIKDLIPKDKGKSAILFEDGTEVVLYKGEVRKLGLKEGMVVSEELYHQIMVEILGIRAKKRAMHLLERQDRTEKQLYDKLKQNGYPESCIEEAVSYVKSYHYIDDLRYARNHIRYHQEKKSLQRLKVDLMRKGVSKEVIEAAIEEEYLFDEKRKIRELLEKKHYSNGTMDENSKRKIYQFLLRRGFKSSDVLSVMREYDF